MPAINAIYFEISGHGDVAKELEDLTNISYEMNREGAAVINTINPARRAKYLQPGIKNYTLEFETVVAVTQEVDWRLLFEDGTIFTLTYEEAGSGRRYQCVDCLVIGISGSNNPEGEYPQTIQILFLDHPQIA